MNKLCFAGLTFALVAGNARAAIDPDLLKLVMPDAKILAGMRVDQSAASPFGQFVLARIPIDNTGFQMFMAATGFDPRRDLGEVLVATDSDTASASHGLLLARGTFQQTQILTMARTLGAAVSAYQGIDVMTSSGQASPFSVAFLNTPSMNTPVTAAIAVAGNPDAVKAAIDRHIAGTAFSGPLASSAKDAGERNQVWFATNAPLAGLLNGQLGNLSNMSPQNLLNAVSSIFGGAVFGPDAVTLSVTTATNTDQNAQGLAEVLRFLSSMAAQTSGAQVEQAGALVHVTMSLSEQKAEQWFTSQQARPRKVAAIGR